MSPIRPNLFLIGAMKSGTSYLRRLLQSHPLIFMCEPDEPSYFVDPEQLKTVWREMWDRGIWQSEECYLRLFALGRDAVVIGEASTNYAKRPMISGIPERIRAFNPDARLIYLMRDPVDRTISHYWHMARYHFEARPLLRAIRHDPQYMDVSHYAMQLLPYLDRFGRDRVMTLTFERLIQEPIATMRSLYDWLGVGFSGVDVSQFEMPEHVTPEELSMAGFGGIPRRLRQLSPLRSIVPMMPQPMRAALRRLTNRPVTRRAVETAGAIEFLRPLQRRQTEELAGLLGRTFDEWTTLHGG